MNEAPIKVRNCTAQDISEFISVCDRSIYHAFRLPESEKDKLIDPDRQIIAVDGADVVGTSGSYKFCLTVPGGNITAAGVTFVGVLQTHRRQGILNRMMRHQINDLYKKGDCIAMLWSSEGDFYRRYGYGVASRSVRLRAEKDRSQIAGESKKNSKISFIDPTETIATLAPIYDEICKRTPGMIRRSEVWWNQLLSNSAVDTHPPVQLVSVRQDKNSYCSGYAIYRTLLTWDGRPGEAVLNIVEAIGLSPKDNEDLWRFFTNMDLVKEIRADYLPIDHPIFLLVREPARLHQEIQDGLWLRLIDLRSALKRRQYSRVGTVVFAVTDQLCPWNAGRWKLEWNGETVSLEKTELDTQISLDISGLASTYLGGITFSELKSAGWLSEKQDGAVIRADELFRWSPAPWCPENF